MICPHCGANIGNGVKLCPQCNKVVDSIPSAYRTSSSTNTTNSSRKVNTTTVRTHQKKSRKKSAILLISAILGVLYAIYSIIYWGSAASGSSSTAYAIGAGIATALVMPHLLCAVLAAIFNMLGWAMNSRGFSLTGAILYAVAMALFPIYAMFVIIQMILSFIGFAQLKKLNGN